MKFGVERNFLVRTYEEIELDPKDFIQCSNIEELNNEIVDYIHINKEHHTHLVFQGSEELGINYWDLWIATEEGKSFYLEWQRLKGLPQEL